MLSLISRTHLGSLSGPPRRPPWASATPWRPPWLLGGLCDFTDIAVSIHDSTHRGHHEPLRPYGGYHSLRSWIRCGFMITILPRPCHHKIFVCRYQSRIGTIKFVDNFERHGSTFKTLITPTLKQKINDNLLYNLHIILSWLKNKGCLK